MHAFLLEFGISVPNRFAIIRLFTTVLYAQRLAYHTGRLAEWVGALLNNSKQFEPPHHVYNS